MPRTVYCVRSRSLQVAIGSALRRLRRPPGAGSQRTFARGTDWSEYSNTNGMQWATNSITQRMADYTLSFESLTHLLRDRLNLGPSGRDQQAGPGLVWSPTGTLQPPAGKVAHPPWPPP